MFNKTAARKCEVLRGHMIGFNLKLKSTTENSFDSHHLEKFSHSPYNHTHYYTQEDHRRQRKVKPEIFPFHPDISGQPADPVKPVMKKINDNPDCNNGNSCKNNIFSSFRVHIIATTI